MINDTQKAFGIYALKGYQNKLLRRAQIVPVSWIGRRMALLLRKAVMFSKPPIIDAVVDDLKLRIYTQDNVSERKFLFMPQFFDSYERSLLKEMLHSGDIFVDVGANAGIYSMTAAMLVGNTGKVLSIEPNPIMMERLNFNATLNGFSERIVTEQSCVSDSEGVFDLTLDDRNLGGSSLVATRSARKISVQCYKLLSLVEKHRLPRIDALKIDIEGAEDKALIPFFEKAHNSLYPKLLILENSPHDWKADLPSELKSAGYQQLKITRMNQVWKLT
ncbi:MAG: FkbM family methyltransferase [Alphaproteobacteria bacterium]|nr:FkbM family methyltransferase [Alphaproteobacteria bacterium]